MFKKVYLKIYSMMVLFGLMVLMVPVASANEGLLIYEDALAGEWEDLSLLTSVNFSNADPVQKGGSSMAVTYNQGAAALYLRSKSLIEVDDYQGLRFSLHGGESGGHNITLTLVDAQNKPLDVPLSITSEANSWTEVEVSFENLTSNTLAGIVWQDASGEAQSAFFIDELSFVAKTFFLETFDGEPEQPESWNSPSWDVTVHSRNVDTWLELNPMNITGCESPATTHMITAYEDAVTQCGNHMMTAINADDYGAIYLTPDYMVDFSEGEAVIRFDLSTARESGRDWIDLWITPYDNHLQLPLTDWLPDLNGEPRKSVHIMMNLGDNSTFKAEVINEFEVEELPTTDDGWLGYEYILDPSATRRDTFELRISETHIKFGMPEHNFSWIDTDISELGWDKGVVQFGHHSYDPSQYCEDCGANTWHWDNVSIEPAVPFTIISANERYIDADTEANVTFDKPAPQNAHLRFAGIGNNIEVSFDGGQTWEDAQLQEQEQYADEHFRSYWTPVPAGTTEVHVRGQAWWGAGWHVRDVSIWALK